MEDYSPESHPFTWEHYRKILSTGLEAGYRYARFRDDAIRLDDHRCSGNPLVFLRHDIENDICAALHMASIEHDAGIYANYFALLRSPNYNPAERRNIHMLKEIAAMGHDVGLHFSLIDHPEADRPHDLPALIREDADILANLLNYDIRSFSFHNPPPDDRRSVPVTGLVNAYADRYFRDAYYTSDSNVRWTRGCPCQTLRGTQHDIVQILAHPNTFPANLADDRDVLLYFLEQKVSDLLIYNVENNRTLRTVGLSMAGVLEWTKRMDVGR